MPLVIIEGIDGSGKTALSMALAQKLGAHRQCFPSHDGVIGRLIRATFTGEARIDAQAMQHLFIADALDHDPQLHERVSRGETVILDRHPIVSGWVYQVESSPIDIIQQISIPNVFTPADVICILDVPSQLAVSRIQERGGVDAGYEAVPVQLMEARRQRYLAYNVMHQRCMLLDGRREIEANVAQVIDILDQLRTAHASVN